MGSMEGTEMGQNESMEGPSTFGLTTNDDFRYDTLQSNNFAGELPFSYLLDCQEVGDKDVAASEHIHPMFLYGGTDQSSTISNLNFTSVNHVVMNSAIILQPVPSWCLHGVNDPYTQWTQTKSR